MYTILHSPDEYRDEGEGSILGWLSIHHQTVQSSRFLLIILTSLTRNILFSNMAKAAVTNSEKTATQIFSEEAMNPLGLFGLNKLMLIYAGQEIASVLRICSDPRNYPIAYHCSSGKDRTGLITALLLSVCGVSSEEIIADYNRSEVTIKRQLDSI